MIKKIDCNLLCKEIYLSVNKKKRKGTSNPARLDIPIKPIETLTSRIELISYRYYNIYLLKNQG